jgi:hypothetical protein
MKFGCNELGFFFVCVFLGRPWRIPITLFYSDTKFDYKFIVHYNHVSLYKKFGYNELFLVGSEGLL